MYCFTLSQLSKGQTVTVSLLCSHVQVDTRRMTWGEGLQNGMFLEKCTASLHCLEVNHTEHLLGSPCSALPVFSSLFFSLFFFLTCIFLYFLSLKTDSKASDRCTWDCDGSRAPAVPHSKASWKQKLMLCLLPGIFAFLIPNSRVLQRQELRPPVAKNIKLLTSLSFKAWSMSKMVCLQPGMLPNYLYCWFIQCQFLNFVSPISVLLVHSVLFSPQSS